jgi:hypothetical protein
LYVTPESRTGRVYATTPYDTTLTWRAILPTKEQIKTNSPHQTCQTIVKTQSECFLEKQEFIRRRQKKSCLKIGDVHSGSIRVGAFFDQRKNTLPERMDLQSSHKIGCLPGSTLGKDGVREPEMHQ